MSQKFSEALTINEASPVDARFGRVVIFYHENCQDGEVANVCAIRGLRDLGCKLEIVSIARSYQNEFNLQEQAQVLLYSASGALIFYVDFAPLPDELTQLSKHNLVVILDHHDTARKNYGITSVSTLSIHDCFDYGPMVGSMIIIDNDRSGAGMTWDFFNPGKDRPDLVKLVEDRDLWRFKHEGSRELALYLQNNPPKNWVNFFNRFNKNHLYRQTYLMDAKKYYEEVQDLIAELSAKSVLFSINDQVSYRLIESSVHHSDLGNKILEDNPAISFAIIMVNKGEGNYKLSFRSEDSRLDVSSLCERFGGGGHRNASGLTLTLSEGETIEGKILDLVRIYLEEEQKYKAS